MYVNILESIWQVGTWDPKVLLTKSRGPLSRILALEGASTCHFEPKFFRVSYPFLFLQTQRVLGTVTGGILPPVIIVVPGIETLRSTKQILWTLWERLRRFALHCCVELMNHEHLEQNYRNITNSPSTSLRPVESLECPFIALIRTPWNSVGYLALPPSLS